MRRRKMNSLVYPVFWCGIVFAQTVHAEPGSPADSVPQIAYDNSPYVQQLPRNAVPWVAPSQPAAPAPAPVASEQPAATNANLVARDFVLDLSAQGFELRLPSVREGIRVSAR